MIDLQAAFERDFDSALKFWNAHAFYFLKESTKKALWPEWYVKGNR